MSKSVEKKNADASMSLDQIEAELAELAARTKVLKELRRKRLAKAAEPRKRKVSDAEIRRLYDDACRTKGSAPYGIVKKLADDFLVTTKTIHRSLNRTKDRDM